MMISYIRIPANQNKFVSMRRESQSSSDLLDSKASQAALIAQVPSQTSFSIHINPSSKNYNLDQFTTKSSFLDKTKKKISSQSKLFCHNIGKKSYYKKKIYSHFPIFKWLPRYNFKNFFFTDMMCGLTIGIMNIPQGLAYALLASLNPITGLYVSFFPVLVYAIFGTSRHLVISAVAIVSLLTGETVNRIVEEYGKELLPANETGTAHYKQMEEKLKLDIATDLSLLIGIFQLLFGLFGLGGLTSFFSDTFISGYTCGSAVHVVVSQIKDLFGLKNLTRFEGNFKIPKSVYQLATLLPSSNVVTVASSFCCIFFLTLFKEALNPVIKKYFLVEFPSELLLIVAMTSVSFGLGLSQNYNVSILQSIPTGFPTPSVSPNLSLIYLIIKDALIISTIAISVSMSLAALFSRRNSYKIDPHQDLLGSFYFFLTSAECKV
ncbi:sulfate permease [Brachionus plicatilis]|uniref:Sulfate permease n=1 Tax=Brachionus plicatilis TaxID=10195 RepID=A0A3M7QTD4_BRAPC|nr:sulfate permease [Brachionus plicatilis]